MEWRDALKEKMSDLKRNKTWEIINRPKEKYVVNYKWIFTLKYKANVTFERHNARFVAK